MSEKTENFYGELMDCLGSVQLGVLYEMLMLNANEDGLNSEMAKNYLPLAEMVKVGIAGNCGLEVYVKYHQELCRQLADYDGRAGYNKSVK